MDHCKPCPECEWDCEPPNAYVEMSDIIYCAGTVKYSEKEHVKLKCPKCDYEVYAKSIREAVSKWNEESDKNIQENHINKWVCKRCGEQFDERPNPEDYISESLLNFSEIKAEVNVCNKAYTYILPCCKFESKRFLNKNNCVSHFEKLFKKVTLQKEIDNMEEK